MDDLNRSRVRPWFAIPAYHKCFRNLVITDILKDMAPQLPPPQVDIEAIHRRFDAAEGD